MGRCYAARAAHATPIGGRPDCRTRRKQGIPLSRHDLVLFKIVFALLPAPCGPMNRLERMRVNPAGDWTVQDVEAVCREHGVSCSPPRGGGSHWKVSHPSQRDILTIPARRPIKPIYIRKLVRFIDGVAGAKP
jgi:hypothetical protein